MCACRQKKSFLIEDILKDTRKKPYKNLSHEPTKPLYCRKETAEAMNQKERDSKNETPKVQELDLSKYHQNLTKFNVRAEVQHEMELSRINLEARRNTYPLYPTAVKANFPWQYRKDVGYIEPRFNYYSDPILNPSLMTGSRYVSHPLPMRTAYGFDRGKSFLCSN